MGLERRVTGADLALHAGGHRGETDDRQVDQLGWVNEVAVGVRELCWAGGSIRLLRPAPGPQVGCRGEWHELVRGIAEIPCAAGWSG